MREDVKVRRARVPDDDNFLIAVFASTRAPELAALTAMGMDGDTFIRSQFAAQRNYLLSTFPNADEYVVTVGELPAGRLVVDRAAEELRFVELALLPGFRRAGVGTTLVERLMAEEPTSSLTVRCEVLEGSEAQLFWENAGFVATGRHGAHLSMERRSATSLG